MPYQHILVAVDLSDESTMLLNKGMDVACCHQAQLSIITVDLNYSDLYTGLVDVNVQDVQQRLTHAAKIALDKLAAEVSYPITHKLIFNGDLASALFKAINQYHFDLIVFGHHQDFWSRLLSSARQIMNTIQCDMLAVPLKKETT